MTMTVVPQETAPTRAGLIRAVANPKELIAYHEELTQIIHHALKDGVDYGVIPGTQKPTLYKPGAERLCIAFGATAQYTLVHSEIDHDRATLTKKRTKVWNNGFKGDRTFKWAVEEGESTGLYRYIYECKIVTNEGRVIGVGQGLCSSLETKYSHAPRDLENTICKMGQKRALIAAVLNGFGLSDRFTQDKEDMPEMDYIDAEEAGTGPTGADLPKPGFDPDMPAHVVGLNKLLLHHNVPATLHAAVSAQMKGKTMDKLADILARISNTKL